MSVYDYSTVEGIEQAIQDLSYMWIIGVYEPWQSDKVLARLEELQEMKKRGQP